MKKLALALVALVALWGFNAAPAAAQSTSAVVVAACGTPPTTYAAGQNRQVTQDTTGRVCGAQTATLSGAIPAGSNTIGNVYEASPFPTGSTQVSVQSNVANAIAQACISGSSGVHTYVTGFAFTSLGATALQNVQATAAGMKFDFQFPAGATAIASPIIVNLTRPYDAGVNTAACATLPAGGAGNASATASIIGFRQ